jgi:hypothetical protein
MTMGIRWQVAVVAAYGLIAAAWAYAGQRQIDLSTAAYDLTHDTFAVISFVLVSILTGLAVGRLWVLLALLGPLLTLGCMQATGYISPWHDGAEPLTSFSGIASLAWLTILLLAGVGLSRMVPGFGSATLDRKDRHAKAKQHETTDQDQSTDA